MPVSGGYTPKEYVTVAKKSGSGGFGKIFLGFLLGIAATAAGLFLYLRLGPLPVAVTDTPFPLEKQIVKLPLSARRRLLRSAPARMSSRLERMSIERSARAAMGLRATTWPLRRTCIPALRSFGRATESTGSSG